MSKRQQQAGGEAHEDQFPNFPASSLDEKVALSPAENAELGAEDIYEVLVSACTDGTSVSVLCKRSEDTPRESSVLHHPCTKFDLKVPKQVGNTLLQKDVLGVPLQQVEVVSDLHLRSYYGDESNTDDLYHSQAKHGIITLHAYVVLYARVKNKRYTLVVHRLGDGDTASGVLAEFLGTPNDLDLNIKTVYLDHGLYGNRYLTLLQTYNHVYVMPIARWGRAIERELSEGWSRMIQHDLTAKLDGHSWTVEFPVYISCAYLNGRHDGHGVARHSYAANAPFADLPRDARYRYMKHSGIKASYRLSE